MADAALYVLYLNVVLYALCYQLQRPLEPFVVDKFINSSEEGDKVYTQLQSWFGMIQLVGSLVVGLLLDKFGVRGAFFVNFFGAGMSYYILANATSVNSLYLSKVPTVLMHGFLCAQTAISQATSDKAERATNLGRLTAAYTVGAAIGPALGGYLGWELSAQFAIVGSFVSAVLVYLFPLKRVLPVATQPEIGNVQSESGTTSTEDVATVEAQEVAPVGSVAKIIGILSKTWSVLSVKLLTGFANSMQSTVMPLFLKHAGMNEQELGFMMSGMRVANAVTNGFMLQLVTSAMSGVSGVISLCLSVPAVLFLIVGLVQQQVSNEQVVFVYAGVTCILTIFQYILGTSLTAESTGLLRVDERGTQLGIEHASFSAARIFSPTVAQNIMATNGLSFVCLACSGIYVAATSLWFVSGSTRQAKLKTDDKKTS